MSEVRLLIGRAALKDRPHNGCCGKPKGCTNLNPGCAYLQHPFKQWLRGEMSRVEMDRRLAA